jgi:cytochrome c551/c552
MILTPGGWSVSWRSLIINHPFNNKSKQTARFKKILRRVGIAAVVIVVLIQAVPYGRNHVNPPVNAEPKWDIPQTRALAKRACFDCHSNETVWPWYSYIAPASWLVQRDVEAARSKLNFSEWNRPQKEADEAAEQIRKGEMPLWFYVPLHPQAKLAAAEKESLIRGLEKTIGHQATTEEKYEESEQ